MRSRPLAKLLLVLAPGTTAIGLLNGHTGTAVLSSGSSRSGHAGGVLLAPVSSVLAGKSVGGGTEGAR
jgi:hypothetical protein